MRVNNVAEVFAKAYHLYLTVLENKLTPNPRLRYEILRDFIERKVND